jgi:hypothetical protein
LPVGADLWTPRGPTLPTWDLTGVMGRWTLYRVCIRPTNNNRQQDSPGWGGEVDDSHGGGGRWMVPVPELQRKVAVVTVVGHVPVVVVAGGGGCLQPGGFAWQLAAG